jgi:heat shock protein HslJ
MKYITSAALVLFILLASCKTTKTVSNLTYNGGSEDLFRYQWNLSDVNGKAQANTGAKLLFSPGQVSRVAGSTGCNNITGTMELSGDHAIKFSPLATTRKACMDGNIEPAFLQAIQQVTHWSINNSKELVLFNGNTAVAKFVAEDISAGAGSLSGTWELEYITGPRIAFEGLYPEKKPTIIFDGTGEYKGNTSCNGMGGKFTTSGSTVKFTPPITTMMACPGSGEQTFLKTLDMIDAYAVEAGKLVLKSKGVDMMRLVKK